MIRSLTVLMRSFLSFSPCVSCGILLILTESSISPLMSCIHLRKSPRLKWKSIDWTSTTRNIFAKSFKLVAFFPMKSPVALQNQKPSWDLTVLRIFEARVLSTAFLITVSFFDNVIHSQIIFEIILSIFIFYVSWTRPANRNQPRQL